jgi:hypothetical protein
MEKIIAILILQGVVFALPFIHFYCEFVSIQREDCNLFRKEQTLLAVFWLIAIIAMFGVLGTIDQFESLYGLIVAINIGVLCFIWAIAKTALMYKAYLNIQV